MSIGWVMFWKTIVVGVYAIIVEQWKAYRKKRRRQGISMRQNRDGVYVPADWTEHVERWAKRVFWGFWIALYISGAFVLYLMFS